MPSRTLSKFIIGEYLHDPTSRGEPRRRTRNIFNKRQRLLYFHYAGKMRAGMKWTVFWITIRLLPAINIVSLGTTRSMGGAMQLISIGATLVHISSLECG